MLQGQVIQKYRYCIFDIADHECSERRQSRPQAIYVDEEIALAIRLGVIAVIVRRRQDQYPCRSRTPELDPC